MDDTEFAITFFSALTVLANVAVVGLLVLASAARLSPADGPAARSWRRLRQDLTPHTSLGLAAFVAVVATAGSLYFSEVADFIPCRLCWIQRGFMYPLVVVLPLAALATRRAPAGAPARWLRRLVVVAALVGGSVSVWHVLIERFPDLESATSCDINNPCSLNWLEGRQLFDFITLPYMALSGFLLIVALVLVAASGSRPAAGAHSRSAGSTRPAKHAKHARRPADDGADDKVPATTGSTTPPPAPGSPEAGSTTAPAAPGQQSAPPPRPSPPAPDLVTPTRTNGQSAH